MGVWVCGWVCACPVPVNLPRVFYTLNPEFGGLLRRIYNCQFELSCQYNWIAKEKWINVPLLTSFDNYKGELKLTTKKKKLNKVGTYFFLASFNFFAIVS